MHVFRRGGASHTIIGRSFTHNTIHKRDSPFPKHFGPSPPNGHSNAGGEGNGNGHDHGSNTHGNTPPTSPPPDPPPSDGGSGSSPSGSAPDHGENGPPAPVPPVVPNSGTTFGSTPQPGIPGSSSTTSGRAMPSAVTGGGVTPTISGGSLGSDNLGSDTDDPTPSSQSGVANAGAIPATTSDSTPQNSGGSNTLDAGSPSPTDGGNDRNNTISGATAESHISTGAVAAIVVIFITLFLALAVFFIRRRSRARRIEQANSWWFYRNDKYQTYGDRNSARSSFLTSVDHSAHTSDVIPALPPMAEVGRVNENSLHNTSRYNTEGPDNRFSIGSNGSGYSQFLVVEHRNSLDELAPAAGQASSPAQSFAFPKPPSPAADRNFPYSRPSTNSSSSTLKRLNSIDALFASAPPTPKAVPLISNDPFAANPFGANNPFEDPQRSTTSRNLTTAFAEEETIRQPFQRTLQGEVMVGTIDCIRESGPASIATKHVSSYGDEGTYTAM